MTDNNHSDGSASGHTSPAMAKNADMAPKSAEREQGRGRGAVTPRDMPIAGWKDILWRVYHAIQQDRILLIAGGATYYLLLALFPALAAFVSIYGFIADPRTVADHIAFLGGVMPNAGFDLIQAQLNALAEQDTNALSFAFLIGFLVAMWSANNGIKAIFESMNIAYREREDRSFVMLTLVSFGFTIGAMVIAIALIVSVGIVPAVLAMMGLGGWTEQLVRLLRWPLLLLFIAAGISLIYRYGPSREAAKWRWITWGGILATLIWVATSAAFSFYLENFADYNATYGTLGALIGFMVWTWISVVILIVGAELNAALEHQTARDTTTGNSQPMGERGATVADTLGAAHE